MTAAISFLSLAQRGNDPLLINYLPAYYTLQGSFSEGTKTNFSMKKPLLILAFATMFSGSLSAQFSLALQGGIQQSRYILSSNAPFLFDPSQEPTPRIFQGGYHIGLVPAVTIASGKAELSVPVSFVQRQFQISEVIVVTEPSMDRFQTIELNPRIGFYLTPDFSLQTGAYVSHILRAYNNMGDGVWNKVPDWAAEFLYNDVDFGLTGGLKYAVRRFSLHGNVQFGLIPLLNMQFTDVNGEPLETTGRNLAFQLGLGYTLIGKK